MPLERVDEQELPSCDPAVFEHGDVVGIFHFGGPPYEKYGVERLCAALSTYTGWKWDWNYAAGRVVLRALKPSEEP